MIINNESLKHLAKLSRIEISPEKEEKTLNDIEKILKHFEELKEVNTDNIEPMAGGTTLTNIIREDAADYKIESTSEKLIEAFPQKKNNFLKVPAVFEE